MYCCIFYVGQCALCPSQRKIIPPPHPSPGKAGTLAEQKPIVDCPGTWGLGQELFLQYLNWRIQLEAWSLELCEDLELSRINLKEENYSIESFNVILLSVFVFSMKLFRKFIYMLMLWPKIFIDLTFLKPA